MVLAVLVALVLLAVAADAPRRTRERGMSGQGIWRLSCPSPTAAGSSPRTTPLLDGGWAQNRDAALIAEEEGFDFVMAMGKWRGFGGDTDHWGTSLEAVTMMAGIAAVTKRVKVWATLHAILHNPVVAAKMIATLDHISRRPRRAEHRGRRLSRRVRADGRLGRRASITMRAMT